jgi:branched-chain amino acid transport system substrate-binding protein
MIISRRAAIASGAALVAGRVLPARSQPAQPVIKLGVLNDQSGPFRDVTGPGSTLAVRLAVADFMKESKSFNIEVIFADHQNKADVGAGIARQWFDREGVDVIVDLPNSAVALAVASIAKDKNKVVIGSGAGSNELTGRQCSPNTLHWTYDTYMVSKSTGASVVRSGGDSWFFITANYAFGQALQRDAMAAVTAAGGKVLGSIPYPFPGTTDFSSFLLQAQSSGANVLALANAGDDTVNCIKQAHEFGLMPNKMKVAALSTQATDVRAIGLELAQGLYLTEPFYWDMNARTRAFTERYVKLGPQFWPDQNHAGCYAGALHYLRAVAAIGADKAKADGAATVAQMKSMPVDDDCFGKYSIRADGRVLVDAHLFAVKTPEESKGTWDVFKLVSTIPGADAFRPMSEGGCPFIAK